MCGVLEARVQRGAESDFGVAETADSWPADSEAEPEQYDKRRIVNLMS